MGGTKLCKREVQRVDARQLWLSCATCVRSASWQLPDRLSGITYTLLLDSQSLTPTNVAT